MIAITASLDALPDRLAREGGFAGQPGGNYRPDATAWACLGPYRWERRPDVVAASLQRFGSKPLKDGRVPITPDYLEAFWPTGEAILAWYSLSAHQARSKRAIEFLLRTTGTHPPSKIRV